MKSKTETVSLRSGIGAVNPENITTDYLYDGSGNQLRKEMGSGQSIVTKYLNYEYDFENRMTKVIFPDNSYEKYLYAPNGKRVAVQKWLANASQPEETTYFVYDAL
ncbi:MAG: hypothetical protein A2252_04935 [Elusimicrobia bacterium RIFOXYA2_FULL_39_19]|nr:MAG: hypothetical protein A2252_04935 [Elusimicrobia bacterium RIFOXYA2_FULL_39_19]